MRRAFGHRQPLADFAVGEGVTWRSIRCARRRLHRCRRHLSRNYGTRAVLKSCLISSRTALFSRWWSEDRFNE